MEPPVFSVVVATHDRPRQLTSLLKSLASIDYPSERFEVIVVDDGSGTPIQPVVVPFQSVLHVTCLRQAQGGVARARQLGVEAARGRYLAFTDDDCEPVAGWLKCMASVLEATPGCAVGGRTVNALTGNPYSSATQALENVLRESWNSGRNGASFFPTSNLAMPADLCREVGGFDVGRWPHGSEDRDLCARWTERGYPLAYAPEAVVYHHHALSLLTFLRQHFGYGRGAFRFREARAQRGGSKLKVEPLAFYFRLPLSGLTDSHGVGALLRMILLAMSQMSNAAGFIWEWVRHGARRGHGAY